MMKERKIKWRREGPREMLSTEIKEIKGSKEGTKGPKEGRGTLEGASSLVVYYCQQGL